jgi:hypothetical protein
MKSELKSFQLVQEWTLHLNQEKTYKHFRASECGKISGKLKISFICHFLSRHSKFIKLY